MSYLLIKHTVGIPSITCNMQTFLILMHYTVTSCENVYLPYNSLFFKFLKGYNDVVILLNVCCMKIVLEYDSNHPKVLLRAIEMFQFLMGAAAKPLNVIKGIKNIKRQQ